jgi:hypothetical protein
VNESAVSAKEGLGLIGTRSALSEMRVRAAGRAPARVRQKWEKGAQPPMGEVGIDL